MQLDETDLALLAAVQGDARLSQAALGARVGLSAAAVNRRLQRLTAAGTVVRTTAVLAPGLLGHPLTVIAHVEVADERADLLDELERTFVACPEVQQCYYVTGNCDFIVVFIVRDMDQYRRLTRELFFASGNVKRFTTHVAMKRSKVTLDVPLPGAGGTPSYPGPGLEFGT